MFNIDKIKNSYKVIDFLGSWPVFHDAEITKVELDRELPDLIMTIYTFLLSKEIDEKGFLKKQKECLITFQFGSLKNLEISNFNHQNVISGLVFKPTADNEIEVLINSIYGLEGKFVCNDINVLLVKELREK